MFDSKKRKRHRDHTTKRNYRRTDLGDGQGYGRTRHLGLPEEEDHTLFIQAHEADLRRGPRMQELARSLEVVEHNFSEDQSGESRPKIGSALILWHGGSGLVGGGDFDDDHDDTISLGVQQSSKESTTAQETSGIWVDRYDARLLLDAPPDFGSPPSSTPMQKVPDSPSGWSDLPSDTEETFFFSPEEADDLRNEKRRRLLERAQEERVKARQEEENAQAQEEVDEDPWGGSDEEPDDAQKEYMRRTAAHLLSSPNPAQLEMRILANHGADKRFAFLKGRWSRSWWLIKTKLRMEKEENERKEKVQENSLGLLAGYDSDSGSDGANAVEEERGRSSREGEPLQQDDEAKKENRRQKAKEWAERRRAEANAGDNEE